MNLLVPALLSNAAIVALLATGAYAVTRIWRNPQLAHALWVLVLLKLVTPPLVNVPLPAWFPTADSRQSVLAGADAARAVPLTSENDPRTEPPSTVVANDTASVTGRGASFAAAPALASSDSMRAWDLSACLLWAWAAGSFVIASVGLHRVRRFAWLVAATEFANDEIRRDADDLARDLGMRSSPPVRIVHGAIPPVVWSLGFRTEILLPAALLAQLGRNGIRSILAHELAHVRRLDHWVRWLEALVVVLYWWNPIVWLVRRELNIVEERCCDTWVVWLVPERRRTYATAIVQTVEFLAAARAVLPVAASGMARSFPLKTRVTAILAEPQAHRLSWPLRLSVVVAALVGLPLSAIPSTGTASATTSATETAAADDNPSEAAATPAADKNIADAKPVLGGRLFARGFWYRSDRIAGKMAIASIDPATGDWKPLVEDSGSFSVTPDGQTIFFDREGALWNGDAQKNENPGKVFAEAGHVVFAPDGKSMLVTTWKRKDDKPEEFEKTVWKMAIDGTAAVPLVDLAPWGMIRDWSSDGKWLLAEKNRSIHLVRPDGKESRLLLKSGDYAHFSPDGQRVVHTIPWTGKIRVIDIDGSNDRAIVELPQMIYANAAYWSPEGKHVASVLMDLAFGNDGTTPVLYADPSDTHPRIAIFDAATGEQRTLELPRQNDWDFYPTGEIEWR
jgi:beta-lactamase regulating signal transducer with metallopeptidase domain